jgi:hypothetical protein
MVLIFPATSGKVQMALCYKWEATNLLVFSLKIHQVVQIIKGNTSGMSAPIDGFNS